jgi:hypothetical protein
MKEDLSALLPNAVVGPSSASSRRSCSAIIDITSHLSGLIAQYMRLGNFDLVVSQRVASPTPKIIDNYELRPMHSYIYHYSSAVPSINAVSNNSSAAYLINNHPVTNTPTHRRSRPQLPTSTRPVYVCYLTQSCSHVSTPNSQPQHLCLNLYSHPHSNILNSPPPQPQNLRLPSHTAPYITPTPYFPPSCTISSHASYTSCLHYLRCLCRTWRNGYSSKLRRQFRLTG